MLMRVPEKALVERQCELQNLISEKTSALSRMPEGVIHIKYNHGYIQYYLRRSTEEKTGRYLKRTEQDTITLFLQKKYDKQILDAATTELNQISSFLAGYDSEHLRNQYLQLDPRVRKYVNPVELPDDLYVKKWSERAYDHLPFFENEPEYYAANGLRVRSKTEALIADLLTSKNIPFLYEYPLLLSGKRPVYPDFTILDISRRKEIYWEHFGMMDDRDYSRNALLKIRDYKHAGHFPGCDLLMTFECTSLPLSLADAEKELLTLMGKS